MTKEEIRELINHIRDVSLLLQTAHISNNEYQDLIEKQARLSLLLKAIEEFID